MDLTRVGCRLVLVVSGRSSSDGMRIGSSSCSVLSPSAGRARHEAVHISSTNAIRWIETRCRSDTAARCFAVCGLPRDLGSWRECPARQVNAGVCGRTCWLWHGLDQSARRAAPAISRSPATEPRAVRFRRVAKHYEPASKVAGPERQTGRSLVVFSVLSCYT